MNKKYFSEIFEFLKVAEKLKTELRHSWTSNSGRQESVAEHTWMMALLAILLTDKLDTSIDRVKVLKMVIIHDLVEAIAGDVPAHELSKRKDNQHINEKAAMKKLSLILRDKIGKDILHLWEEFEKWKTPEAKFVRALDKFEVILQHNVAGVKTWDEGDFRYTLNDIQDNPFNFSSFMRKLKDYLDDRTYEIVERTNTTSQVPKENLKRYKSRKR